MRYRFIVVITLLLLSNASMAGQVSVAVASNALGAVKSLAQMFEKQTGHKVRISSGSTGKLYAQIMHGAPYDVFLAANAREPERLEQAGKIVSNSRFTYALGKLIAFSDSDMVLNESTIKKFLSSNIVSRIAIANPKTAPYGLAAQQAMQKLGIWQGVQQKIIRGENVSQTYQFVASKNAQVGFFAKSQILQVKTTGQYWEVPGEYYQPIRQQAVWLLRAKENPAVAKFIQFMKSASAADILVNRYGYAVVNGYDVVKNSVTK